MKYMILVFLLFPVFTIQAQNKSDYISEEKIITFAKSWQWQNSLKYLEAMKEAQKVFIIGKKVNQTLLKQHFSTNSMPLWTKELRQNNLQEYMLFAGGNGIIGQAIVLFINPKNKVEKLEIIGWGM